jgi:hypothetical protein
MEDDNETAAEPPGRSGSGNATADRSASEDGNFGARGIASPRLAEGRWRLFAALAIRPGSRFARSLRAAPG